MNNEWQAEKLRELVEHVHQKGEMPILQLPFHLLGIGTGANIAACFAVKYASSSSTSPLDLRRCLKSMILLNGFARVDNQLAAVLHSSIDVFSCFSNKRPDLPISYFTKFIFSDDYLQRVDKNLALNIYTAITNPITLEVRRKNKRKDNKD